VSINLPHAIDVHVGNRVRSLRLQNKMSQQALAKAIGLSFQQVQKYENGGNRISVSTLCAIAAALSTPVQWFFENLPQPSTRQPTQASPAADLQLLLSAEGAADLARYWPRLAVEARRNLLGLMKSLSQPVVLLPVLIDFELKVVSVG
jgi:transcriptional regulator with XRE-family HTH domain